MVGIPLVTGGEDRQWLSSPVTRGADGNYAHVFARLAKPADPQPGTGSAPELARHERIEWERAALLPEPVEPLLWPLRAGHVAPAEPRSEAALVSRSA